MERDCVAKNAEEDKKETEERPKEMEVVFQPQLPAYFKKTATALQSEMKAKTRENIRKSTRKNTLQAESSFTFFPRAKGKKTLLFSRGKGTRRLEGRLNKENILGETRG